MELKNLEEQKQLEAAEPYRFNFEIAWEVANKGECVGIGERLEEPGVAVSKQGRLNRM